MKNGRLFLLLLIFFLASFSGSIAQNIQFSQYYSAPMVLGPSFAGLSGKNRITLNYRDQWPEFPGVFRTFGFGYDAYLPKLKSGMGVLVLRDQAGSGKLSLTEASLLYSYNIVINKYIRVRPGLSFKYAQRSIDYYSLIFGDQLDPNFSQTTLPTTTELPKFRFDQVKFIDFSASCLVYSDIYWAGVTVDNLLTPNVSLFQNESEESLLLSFYGGVRFYFEKSTFKRRKNDASISISALYKSQGGYDQLDIGVYWQRSGLSVGTWFRGMPVVMKELQKSYSNVDALIFMLGYKFETLSFGYSYDFTISDLISNTGGSHEVALIFEFKTSGRFSNKRRKAQVPCPIF